MSDDDFPSQVYMKCVRRFILRVVATRSDASLSYVCAAYVDRGVRALQPLYFEHRLWFQKIFIMKL